MVKITHRILYEDPYLLAVSKLRGELTVEGKTRGQQGTHRERKLPLLDFLRKSYPELRAIHRLDFETSGVVVFARGRKVLQQILEEKFRGWRKRYLALVSGSLRPRRGVIRKDLPTRKGWLGPSETSYRVLEEFPGVCFVSVEIESGRRHQIRRHFAGIGCPLILDDLYGDRKFNHTFAQRFGYHNFFLHAVSLQFPHPVTGKEVRIEAPLPPAFEKILLLLRGGVGN